MCEFELQVNPELLDKSQIVTDKLWYIYNNWFHKTRVINEKMNFHKLRFVFVKFNYILLIDFIYLENVYISKETFLK